MQVKRKPIEAGMRIGRLVVLALVETGGPLERRWKCRCDCGNEKDILERSLLYSGTQSCGCLRIEKYREKKAHDLTGKTFGDLTVVGRAEDKRKNAGLWWMCRCACGETYACPATLLVNGRRTHCGCKTNRGRPSDISGKKFNRLTALYPLSERDGRGSVLWHCLCECGNEVDVSYNTLMYTQNRSCGCQKKTHDKMLPGFLTHVDGTTVDVIRSKKIRKDNTTGYTGVNIVRGKYIAKIEFRQKRYYLGAYQTIEDAIMARRKAESVLFDEVVDYYDNYRKYADAHPGWEHEHPIRIRVDKDGTDFKMHIEPAVPVELSV